MEATATRHVDRRRLRAVSVIGAAVAIAICALASTPGAVRVLVAVALTMLFLALAVRTPRAVLVGLVLWLAVLGVARRMLTGVSEASSFGDPLIAVGAIAWLILGVVAISRGALRDRSRLASWVSALVGVLLLSALNPTQGGLQIGVAGAFLVVMPMLAFFVGRTMVDDVMLRRLLLLVAALAVLSAVYGLIQTFHGFPSWDATWLRDSGYSALRIGTATRAFANFSAASEYASFLVVGLLITMVMRRRPFPMTATVILIGLFGVALWYESSRAAIVLAIAATGFVLAARYRVRLLPTIVVGLAGVAMLTFVMKHAVATQQTPAAPTLASHQVSGLADPFGQQSTLSAHLTLAIDGVREAVRRPLGVGVGAISNASSKYGNGQTTTENDVGNAAVAGGLVGLIAFIGVLVTGLRRAHALATSAGGRLQLVALGLLAGTLMQWLNGGQYAVAWIPWLILGWADRVGTPQADQAASAPPQLAVV